MDEKVLVATRRSLHAVAEQLLAGPQYRERGTIRLRASPGGFAQVQGPVRVDGTDLVAGDHRVPLAGTIGEVAAAAGLAAGVPEGLYGDHADWAEDEALVNALVAAGHPSTPGFNEPRYPPRGRAARVG